jgi:hypothetical protein
MDEACMTSRLTGLRRHGKVANANEEILETRLNSRALAGSELSELRVVARPAGWVSPEEPD